MTQSKHTSQAHTSEETDALRVHTNEETDALRVHTNEAKQPSQAQINQTERTPLKHAERRCLLAFLVQLTPPWLLLGLAHIAYAEPTVLSVQGEAFFTSLLLGMSALTGLGMGGSGLYLLLRNGSWRRRTWAYAFLGWIALFAGIVYAQALLIFWAWA
jgi:hypothetical protein